MRVSVHAIAVPMDPRDELVVRVECNGGAFELPLPREPALKVAMAMNERKLRPVALSPVPPRTIEDAVREALFALAVFDGHQWKRHKDRALAFAGPGAVVAAWMGPGPMPSSFPHLEAFR